MALEAELEELRHRLGRALVDFVGACGTSLAEHLDDVPCCVWDIVSFGVCRALS